MDMELCNVEELSEDNMPLLVAVINRAKLHAHMNKCIVTINSRDTTGWLEFHVFYDYEDGGRLTVGALQRKPGEPFEFHS